MYHKGPIVGVGSPRVQLYQNRGVLLERLKVSAVRFLNWPYSVAIILIVLAGAALWAMTAVLHNGSTGITVSMTLIGGALAIIGTVALNRIQNRNAQKLYFGSLLRSIRRSLMLPPVAKLFEFATSKQLPSISLLTPIQIVHLSECLALAAADPTREKLYTGLMEVDKAVRHLTLLRSITPLLQTSAWGIHDVDVVAMEDGKQDRIDAPVWRYYRNAIQGAYYDDQMIEHLTRDLLPEAERLLKEALRQLGVTEFPEPDRPYPSSLPRLDPKLERIVAIASQPYSEEALRQMFLALSDVQVQNSAR